MLETFFTSKVRVKLLKLFFLSSEGRFHVREITRQIDEEINAVRRELQRLYKVKLLGKEKRGNRLYYFLKEDFVFYQELMRMLIKEFDLGGELRKSKDIGKALYCGLAMELFQSRAKDHKEIDLLLVGDVKLDPLGKIVSKYERELQKNINYTVLSEEEFLEMKSSRSPFIKKFFDQQILVLIGDPKSFFDMI